MEGTTAPSNLTSIIVLWNGNLSAVPEGWALCDGENGTPNLTDRFVMSVGEFENPGAMGGSSNHSHSYDEIPNHDHSVEDWGHDHEIHEKVYGEGILVTAGTYIDRADRFTDFDYTFGRKIYFNPDPAGIENCISEPSSSLPPYIKLSYIMKTSSLTEFLLPANIIL
jgi:microcystin-dependent protein